MKQNSKRGFYAVEAAIFLPVFIIFVLTAAFLMKYYAIGETAVHIMGDEASRASYEACFNPAAPVADGFKVKDRVEDSAEAVFDAESTGIYPYSLNGISNLARTDLSFRIRLGLPLGICDSFGYSGSVVYRGFVGVEGRNVPASRSEFEEDKDSETVWVFPKAGSRYHREDCSFIKVYPRQVLLTSAVKRKYKPCPNCNPGRNNGTTVYCFPAAGKAYHTGKCPSVDKYVISMEKEEAEARGYTACLKCCP
ncbi:MAG: hypothetical protein K6F52_01870 [Clostridia bacterium]|nr:hypothetical protein [Clostridia bacterium]